MVFVDGWTGKGKITRELEQSCAVYPSLQPILAVLADPAHSCALYATRQDIINPSCCLNSTVCGLISRTVCNDTLVGPHDFHGVRIYREFAHADQTARYLDGVCAHFIPQRDAILDGLSHLDRQPPDNSGMRAAEEIGKAFGISDLNRVKPGIGETTRVLLRRVPDRILIQTPDHPELAHIYFLAREKQVPIQIYPHMPYLCCGLIADRREEST